MDFTPGPSQQAVASLAAEVLGAADPWKELARAGLLDVAPPDGLGVLDAAVLLTEIGRHAPPDLPFRALATLVLGALPVARWGDASLRQALLPGAASGELILTAAIREPSDPQPDPAVTTVTDGTITGTKIGVPYAAESARLLIPARLATSSMIMGRSGQIAPISTHDHGVALVDPRAEGVSLTRTPSATGQPEYTVRLAGAGAGAWERGAGGGRARGGRARVAGPG